MVKNKNILKKWKKFKLTKDDFQNPENYEQFKKHYPQTFNILKRIISRNEVSEWCKFLKISPKILIFLNDFEIERRIILVHSIETQTVVKALALYLELPAYRKRVHFDVDAKVCDRLKAGQNIYELLEKVIKECEECKKVDSDNLNICENDNNSMDGEYHNDNICNAYNNYNELDENENINSYDASNDCFECSDNDSSSKSSVCPNNFSDIDFSDYENQNNDSCRNNCDVKSCSKNDIFEFCTSEKNVDNGNKESMLDGNLNHVTKMNFDSEDCNAIDLNCISSEDLNSIDCNLFQYLDEYDNIKVVNLKKLRKRKKKRESKTKNTCKLSSKELKVPIFNIPTDLSNSCLSDPFILYESLYKTGTKDNNTNINNIEYSSSPSFVHPAMKVTRIKKRRNVYAQFSNDTLRR